MYSQFTLDFNTVFLITLFAHFLTADYCFYTLFIVIRFYGKQAIKPASTGFVMFAGRVGKA